MNRRTLLLGAASLLGAPSILRAAGHLVVAKDPTCGCCSAWVEHMRRAGFSVETTDLNPAALEARKARLGVPPALVSCHTAEIEGYVVEGHVPAADVELLIASRLQIHGLAVPGMPIGSPGMDIGDSAEPFETLAFRKTGEIEVFSRWP